MWRVHVARTVITVGLAAAVLSANQFLGPPLGGFLTAIAPALPVLTSAVSFAASAIWLRTIGATAVPRPATDRTRLRALAVAVGAINLALTASFTLLVLVARVSAPTSAPPATA